MKANDLLKKLYTIPNLKIYDPKGHYYFIYDTDICPYTDDSGGVEGFYFYTEENGKEHTVENSDIEYNYDNVIVFINETTKEKMYVQFYIVTFIPLNLESYI